MKRKRPSAKPGKLWAAIEAELKKRDESMTTASDNMGLGKDGLRNIRRGLSNDPRGTTLQAIADYFGWDLSQIPTVDTAATKPSHANVDGLEAVTMDPYRVEIAGKVLLKVPTDKLRVVDEFLDFVIGQAPAGSFRPGERTS